MADHEQSRLAFWANIATILSFLGLGIGGCFWKPEIFIAAIEWLTGTVEIKAWAFLLLVVLALFTALDILIGLIALATESSESSQPPYTEYTEDEIFDVHWNWEWPLRSGNLQGRCVSDKTLLVVQHAERIRGFHRVSEIDLRCETCGRSWPFEDASLKDLHARVIRQIEQKVYTDSWRPPPTEPSEPPPSNLRTWLRQLLLRRWVVASAFAKLGRLLRDFWQLSLLRKIVVLLLLLLAAAIATGPFTWFLQ